MSHSNQYSTLAVAAPRRFDYWKEVVCRHCLAADSKPLAQSDFDGALEVHGMGPLDICTLSSPLHYWERAPRHFREAVRVACEACSGIGTYRDRADGDPLLCTTCRGTGLVNLVEAV